MSDEPEVTEIDLEDSMHQLSRSGDGGSTDPLLQIPTPLSAVLTLKRHSGHQANAKGQVETSYLKHNGSLTPLLKRKRESIV